MKKYGAFFAVLFLFQLNGISQQLQKIWETDTIFRVPESVLFDAKGNLLFVSNIDGDSKEKDGKGHISKIGTDGKIIDLTWVSGLNAPKGMASKGNMLYVADVDAVVGIDIPSAMVIKRVEIPGAKFLNDLAMDEAGTLFVSDSETGIIHEISDVKPKPLITGRTRPNGVLWFNKKLYFADAGALYSYEKDGNHIEIARGMERSTDGIEPYENGRFIVSSWVGAIYLVSPNGQVKELLNTKDNGINTADIGYDKKKKILYVPTFNSNRVVAYKIVKD